MLAVVGLIAACGSEEPAGDDPPGFSCEYSPFGDGTGSFSIPTPEELGDFDYFLRVRVTGHRQQSSAATIYNLVTVEESVFGPISEDETLELPGGCLETGESYYVLLDGPGSTGYSQVRSPWSSFSVINNRITLHPDMRKDDVIGKFHGLDPVLFKRRFVEFVNRDDIQVD